MNIDELVKKLSDMYKYGSGRDESVVMVHLFGVKYADELSDFTAPQLKSIAKRATGHKTYGVELAKMLNLAKYVTLNELGETDFGG